MYNYSNSNGCDISLGVPVELSIAQPRSLNRRIGYKNIPVNFGGAPKVPDSGK